jgi:A/G-specific adenine glycosylase
VTPLSRSLLRWYDRARRDLPWREIPSAYGTLVSELMLQQTGVATVVPYFRRFMRRFPDLATLGAASEDEVTALWSGLGYYARARNLRRAAQMVVAEHGGKIPATETELRALPGIGPYTAAAVAAIAFGARAFALDGNAIRVMARLSGEASPIELASTKARLHARGLGEVPPVRAGDFNQAVMELGATVCTPRRPRCGECPIAAGCAARATGNAEALPIRLPRRERPRVRIVCTCLVDGGRVLVVKRPSGLLAGTWSLPEAPSRARSVRAEKTARKVAEAAGVRAAVVEYRGEVRHVFTHRDVTADVFRIEAGGRIEDARGGEGVGEERRGVAPKDLEVMGVSSFTRKTVGVGLG